MIMLKDPRTTATLVRTERASQVRVTGGICVNQASRPTTGIWMVAVRSATGDPARELKMRMRDVGAVVQWDVAGYIGPWNRLRSVETAESDLHPSSVRTDLHSL